MNNKYFKLYSFFINAIKTCRYSDTWQSLKKCDVLLVRNDVDCAYMHQGMAYGHLIDTIGELFDKKGLVVRSVATPYAKLFGNSAFNTPVNLNRATLLIDSFGIIVRLLKGAMFYTNWVKRYKIRLWGKILKKANPSFIIAIMPCESLCQAGKLSNVLVYDLQHGVIADEHWYYGYKTRLDADVRDLPDCFLCWDIQSKTYLQKWTQEKGIGINVIGNPWFSRFAFPDRDDQLVNHAINSGKIFNNENPTILFTLAWGMRKEYLDVDFNGVMIAEMEKVILETCEKYNWLLRLHPIQLLGKEKKSAISYLNDTFKNMNGIEWEKCSQLPLPVILHQTDIHITDSSTVTIEASWFGIRTGILNQQISRGGKHESYYLNERNEGIAEVLLQNKDTIKKWISDRLSQGRKKQDCFQRNNMLTSFIEEKAVNIGVV